MLFMYRYNRKIILLALLLVSACAPVPVSEVPTLETPTQVSFSSRDTLTGEWMGAATQPDGTTASIQIDFENSATQLSVEPGTQSWKVDVLQDGDAIQFSTMGDDAFKSINFNGTFVNGVLSGELSWDGTNSHVTFHPIASVVPSVIEEYEGVYRFESGRALSVIVSPEFSSGGVRFFSQSLMLTDFESGALRGLYPLDEYTFAVGALRVVGAPFAGRIQFIVDDQGNTTGLMWWDAVNDIAPSASSGQFAKRVEYKQEDVRFTSADGISLAGRISLPMADLPVPAFMMLHGSEQGRRDNFGNKLMAHYMISQGFAILNYDKRGVGESEGVYQEAASASNLQKHADDAIAGVQYLASRPEIDTKRIGLIGFSQAGWVIPLAASQSEAVTYFVILSGPVASTAHENAFSSYTNDGESVANYDDAKITQQLRDLRPSGFDPLPTLSQVNQPGLWLWGSVDKSVPVTYSAENLQALIDSGKTNFSHQILEGGDHGLNASPNGLFSEIPYSPGLVYYTKLSKWLQTNMNGSKE